MAEDPNKKCVAFCSDINKAFGFSTREQAQAHIDLVLKAAPDDGLRAKLYKDLEVEEHSVGDLH